MQWLYKTISKSQTDIHRHSLKHEMEWSGIDGLARITSSTSFLFALGCHSFKNRICIHCWNKSFILSTAPEKKTVAWRVECTLFYSKWRVPNHSFPFQVSSYLVRPQIISLHSPNSTVALNCLIHMLHPISHLFCPTIRVADQNFAFSTSHFGFYSCYFLSDSKIACSE